MSFCKQNGVKLHLALTHSTLRHDQLQSSRLQLQFIQRLVPGSLTLCRQESPPLRKINHRFIQVRKRIWANLMVEHQIIPGSPSSPCKLSVVLKARICKSEVAGSIWPLIRAAEVSLDVSPSVESGFICPTLSCWISLCRVSSFPRVVVLNQATNSANINALSSLFFGWYNAVEENWNVSTILHTYARVRS